MANSKIPMFEIIDIIRLKRGQVSLKTENKSCYCISCRISGESTFFYKDDALDLKRGDILYVPQKCNYSQQTEGEDVICFHLEVYGDLSRELVIYKNDFKDEMCRLFEEAEKLWKQKEDNYYYSCLSILYKILSMCGNVFAEKSGNGKALMNESLEYLTANIFDSQLTVDDIYKKSKIGRPRFNKEFKNIFGVTPREYIYRERIKKAKMLLKSGNYTNEEIAYLCGFSDVKYFYVVFKKVTGKTTKEYKK